MSKFQDAIKDMKKKREATAEEIALFVEAEAKVRVKVKSGNTRRSITHETEHEENRSIARVGSNLDHVPALEEGSKPHEIKSKDGKPLKLNIHGRWVTVAKVNHPGPKEQPFLRPSIEDNISEIQQMIKRGMSVGD